MGGNSLEPLKIPIIFWLIGISIGKFLCLSFPIIFILFAAIFIVVLFGIFRKYLVLLLILLLGMMHIQENYPPNHIFSIIQKHQEIMQPIKGRIASEVVWIENRSTFILELHSIKDFPVKGKIKFSCDQDSLQFGDEIETVAVIRKIFQNSNPASFDYQEYLRAKDVFASGFTKTKISIVDNRSNFYHKTMISARKFLRKRIEERAGEYQGFIKAILIADKSDREQWQSILNLAGLSHLLAVSGLHVGIIYLVLLSILQIMIPNRNLARILLIFLLIFYAGICNWTPSVTRAALMISLYLLAKILQRKVDANYILLLSLFLITLFSPKQLFTVGLQLSFLAVFVLLNVIPNLKFIKIKSEEIRLLNLGKKILNAALILIFTSLILNLFLNPLIIYNFKQFNFNGLIGNLIGIPLISFILPLSFFVILLPEVSFIISVYQNSLHFLLKIFGFWANFASSLPFHFDFISLEIWQILLLYAILFSLFSKKFQQKKKYLFCTGLSALLAITFFWNSGDDKLKITFFDCGLGDLHLIETIKNENILIDSGPPETNSKHFIRSALPYFQENAISTLDWVIITHAHNDHYGGLSAILNKCKVENLVLTDEFMQRKIWQLLYSKIEQEKCEIFTITDTLTLPINSVKLKILHPDSDYHDENRNNCSITCRLDYDEFSILFTGDLEKEAEEYLLRKYRDFLDIDFLKIGHHGSKTSSTFAFIKATSPKFGVIPTALKNRFGFPHAKTMKKYEFLEDNLFITGKDGAVQISCDGKNVWIKTVLTEKYIFDKDIKD